MTPAHWVIIGAAIAAVVLVGWGIYSLASRNAGGQPQTPKGRQLDASAADPALPESPPPPVVHHKPDEHDHPFEPDFLDADDPTRGPRRKRHYKGEDGVWHPYPPGEPPFGLDENGDWKHAPFVKDCARAQDCWCYMGKHCEPSTAWIP
jgi:hypothetical protein